MPILGTLDLGSVPILNSSCPWSSSRQQLDELYHCPYTGAVATRTATLNGFAEDLGVHKHSFFRPDGAVSSSTASSSINTYGYSPRPLSAYLEDVSEIIASDPQSSKPFIISITGSPKEVAKMLGQIQDLRYTTGDTQRSPPRIGVELNVSCPNITGKPPPAYHRSALLELLWPLCAAASKDPTLTVGVKLPPFTYHDQFTVVIDALETFTPAAGEGRSPIAYLASTNTLGLCLVDTAQMADGDDENRTLVGGMAGESIHALSAGNVVKFSSLLSEGASYNPALSSVQIVGIGGVQSAAGAQRMFQAGASAVACATGLGRFGIDVFARISEGLEVPTKCLEVSDTSE